MKQSILFPVALVLLLMQCAITPGVLGQSEKVGINTSNPEETLHVNGTIRSDTLSSDHDQVVLADSNGTLKLARLGGLTLRDSSGTEIFDFDANSGFIVINPPPPPPGGGGGGGHGPIGVKGKKPADTVYIQIKIDVEDKSIELEAEEVDLPRTVTMESPSSLGTDTGHGGGRCGLGLDPDAGEGGHVRVEVGDDTLTVAGAGDSEPGGVAVGSSGHLDVHGHGRCSLGADDDDSGHASGLHCDAETRSVRFSTDQDSLDLQGLTPHGHTGVGLHSTGRLVLSGEDPFSGLSSGLTIDPSSSAVRLTGGALEVESGPLRLGNVELDGIGLHVAGPLHTSSLIPHETGGLSLISSDSDVEWILDEAGSDTVRNNLNGFEWITVRDSDASPGNLTTSFDNLVNLGNNVNWDFGQPGLITLTAGNLVGGNLELTFDFDKSEISSADRWRFSGGAEFGDVVVEGPVIVTGMVENPGPLPVTILDDLDVAGNLTKSSGTFRIDHPLDPYNKDLLHSFVESPDMMNVYNGNVTTDDAGFATVELPDYFEALNVDFRYQLTVIGQFAQAIVSKEIVNNKFVIQTDKPNIKVSWQVTGVRNDPYAREHRVVVEQEKPDDLKGSLRYEPDKDVHEGSDR